MNNGMRTGGIFHSESILKGFHFKKRGVLLEQAKILEKAGAEQIELTADLFDAEPFPIDYLQQEVEKLLELKKRGMLFSLHAQCIAGVATASSHERIRRASVETIIEGYLLTEMLEPITVTMHPTILAEIDREIKPANKSAKKYLVRLARGYEEKSLLELSEAIPSHKICIENHHDGDIWDYKDLIEKYGYSVCYDLPHDYVRNPGITSCDRFFNKWGRYIRNIHLHNITSQSLFYGLPKLKDHESLTDPNGLIHAEVACRQFNYFGYRDAVIVEEYNNKDIADSIRMVRRIIEKIKNEKASE